MSKKREEKQKKLDEQFALLEKEQKFNQDVLPYFYKPSIVVDKDYNYLPKNRFERFYARCLKLALHIPLCVLNFFVFRVKIKGRKNLKLIKNTGAVSISNHVLHLDSLLVKQAVRLRRDMYYIVDSRNIVEGFPGWNLRMAGCLPLPHNIASTRNYYQAVDEVFKKKRLIHFYPEQALWPNYKKPRPYKSGAFRIAKKYDVPVLPMFITFEKPKGLRKLFKMRDTAVVNILEPVEVNKEISDAKACVEDLKDRVYQSVVNCYVKSYGIDDLKEVDAEQYITVLGGGGVQ